MSGIEQSLVSFQAIASDPEGDPIDLFYAGSVPIGASFLTNATNTIGTFQWTPGSFQAHDYTILLSATSARRPSEVSGVIGPPQTTTKNVYVRIANLDRPPTLVVPDHVYGAEHATFGFPAQGSDPDEDVVTVTMADLPAGSTVTPFGSGATFTWTPQTGQAGEYSVTVTAQSTSLSSSESVAITVQPNVPPVLVGPTLVRGRENEPVSFQVHASDPDGDEMTRLWALRLPFGASFSAEPGQETGTFAWTPGYDQAGAHLVSISARSAIRAVSVSGPVVGSSEDTLVTRIEIANVDRPPVIPPLSNRTVDEGDSVRITLYVQDPDRDRIQLSLFGPSFARLEQEEWYSGVTIGLLELKPGYLDAGFYPANRIRAEAGDGSAEVTFDILVQERSVPPLLVSEGRAFLTAGNEVTRLYSGKPTTCAQIEPIGDSYVSSAVDLATIVMISPGTGAVSQSPSIPGETTIGGDRDHNGTTEITACFSKESLRLLFRDLPPGSHIVPVKIEGSLLTGGIVRADLDMPVISSVGGLASSLSSTPARSDAILTVHMAKAGPVTVSLFDAHGRLVRTLLRQEHREAGSHDFRLDGAGRGGSRLRSGVYFYRVTAPEGQLSGRLVVAR